MRSEQIKYFLELAQCGSLSEVAEKNFLTQPAVSTAITKLEKELGVRLIVRSNKGVLLTEAGHAAQQIFWQMQQLNQQLHTLLAPYRFSPAIQTEHLTICTTLEIGKYLDPLIGQFRQQHPSCLLSVREYDFLDILSAVGQKQCDFGIFCIINDVLQDEYIQKALSDYQLAIEKIGTDQLYVGVAKSSPLAQQPSLSLKTILQQPLVIYNSSLEKCWHELFLKQYTLKPKFVTTNRRADLLDLVLHQGYLAFLLNYSFLSASSPQQPSYVLLPVKERIKVTIGLLIQKQATLPPYGTELIQTIRHNSP